MILLDCLSTAEGSLRNLWNASISLSECDDDDDSGETSEYVLARIQNLEHLFHRIKKNIQCVRNRNRALSPISRLPPEILENIFSLTVHLVAPITAPDAVLALSHVSSYWREVAIAESALWIDIHVEWPPKRQEVWLQRSKQRLLHIHETQQQQHRSPGPVGISTLAALMGQSHRWRSFEAKKLTKDHLDAFFALVLSGSHDLSNLELISIEGTGCDSLYSSPPLTLPSLRKMRFDSACMNEIQHHGITHTLVELQFESSLFDLRTWSDLLRACTSLETLSIASESLEEHTMHNYLGDFSRAGLPYPPVHLGTLRNLYVYVNDRRDVIVKFIFDHFRTPLLRNLLFDIDLARDQDQDQDRQQRRQAMDAVFQGVYTFVENTAYLSSLTIFHDEAAANAILSSLSSHSSLILNTLNTIKIDCHRSSSSAQGESFNSTNGGQYDLIREELETFLEAQSSKVNADELGSLMALRTLVLRDCPPERHQWLEARVEELRVERVFSPQYVRKRNS